MYIQYVVLLLISAFMSGIGEEKRLGNSNHSIFYRDGFTLHLLGSLFAHDVNLCQPFPSERCSAILSREGWLFDTCGFHPLSPAYCSAVGLPCLHPRKSLFTAVGLPMERAPRLSQVPRLKPLPQSWAVPYLAKLWVMSLDMRRMPNFS